MKQNKEPFNQTPLEQLRRLYQAPAPQEKEQFFKSSAYQRTLECRCREDLLNQPDRMSWVCFFLTQVSYIRKRSWIISIGIYLVFLTISITGMMSVSAQTDNLIPVWFISACIPFLALVTLTEGTRSVKYGMSELELASRFSLPAILCARLGALAIENLLLLLLMMPALLKIWGADPAFTVLSVLLPYLMTCTLSLTVIRRTRTKDSTGLCAGISCLICAFWIILGMTDSLEIIRQTPLLIPAALIFFAADTGIETVKYIRQSEEYSWNFT